jgi:homoaconitate hydratase
MSQNAIEKIAARFASGIPDPTRVRSGDFLTVRPLHVMTHDNSGAVLKKFRSLGARRVADPTQPVFALDHDVQNRSEQNLAKYAEIEAFAREQGIVFHPAGRGIGHQIMAEEGFARPGALVVGSDSHSNLYGALSALGTPVVRTDAAAIWATGTTWWQVPPVAKVTLRGALRPGVSGKDVILSLIARYPDDEVLNHAIEFHGDGVASLTMDQRLTIANMTTEWGALVGWFPFDARLRDWLRERARVRAARGDEPVRLDGAEVERLYAERVEPDAEAWYAKEIEFELGQVSPYVAGPDQVKLARPVAELAAEGLSIDKAYLLSCVNGRLEDLREAAEVLRGKHIPDEVGFYVAAASSEVEEAARGEGVWQVLLDAGAVALPSGCGPCIGLGEGTLAAGEVGISATNRNFKGRMGDRSARTYLASPAVVAASALAGRVSSPFGDERSLPPRSIVENPRPPRGAVSTEILEGFPARLRGRLLWLPQDNLDTDGIYGKDWTYRDDMTPPQMAEVAMRNYDPRFQEIAREGDLIVGGENFGTGSSREQAATALQYRGIRLVLAASFSETYKRNAFNNGYVVAECPELVELLRESHRDRAAAGEKTIPVQGEAEVDFAAGVVRYLGREFAVSLLSPTAQELVLAGGSEGLVRRRLAEGA